MPLLAEEKRIQEDGKDKLAFVTTFTNGALDQLEELRQFFKQVDKLSIIRFAISTLQHHKDKQEEKGTNNPSSA